MAYAGGAQLQPSTADAGSARLQPSMAYARGAQLQLGLHGTSARPSMYSTNVLYVRTWGRQSTRT
eukprot:365711-Chlamydomonas_euryale.AAC.13